MQPGDRRQVGFRQEGDSQREGRQPERAQEDEHALPAADRQDQGADAGSEHGADGHRRDQIAHLAGGFVTAVAVAQDGAPQHHAGAAADGLQGPDDEQPEGRGGEKAADGGDQEQAETGEDDRATAVAIGERADDELGGGKAR